MSSSTSHQINCTYTKKDEINISGSRPSEGTYKATHTPLSDLTKKEFREALLFFMMREHRYYKRGITLFQFGDIGCEIAEEFIMYNEVESGENNE